MIPSFKLKRSLRKLLDYDFDVLLLCDGKPALRGGKLKTRRVFEHASPESATSQNFPLVWPPQY
jgi:hypothetical protein